MGDFTVKSANVKKTFPSKDGKGDVQILALVLTDNDGDHRAELLVFPGTSAPKEGEKLNGTLKPNGDYAPKFERTRMGGFGGGGPRPEDPAKARHIARMHAQDMALQFASLMQTMGKLESDPDKPFTRKTLQVLIQWFEDDAAAARDRVT